MLKNDTRPRRGSWAPGDYMCWCSKCSKPFSGDKRAVTCADCAYAVQQDVKEAEIVLQVHSKRSEREFADRLLLGARSAANAYGLDVEAVLNHIREAVSKKAD